MLQPAVPPKYKFVDQNQGYSALSLVLYVSIGVFFGATIGSIVWMTWEISRKPDNQANQQGKGPFNDLVFGTIQIFNFVREIVS